MFAARQIAGFARLFAETRSAILLLGKPALRAMMTAACAHFAVTGTACRRQRRAKTVQVIAGFVPSLYATMEIQTLVHVPSVLTNIQVVAME
jgi:hypothetical protein